MTYFVEGLQGSGKSTLVQKLAERSPDFSVFREGDYSPVELAWCAYLEKEKYELVLDKYADIKKEIEEKAVAENGCYVVPYTQILTDISGFHKDLEQYEIYNGRRSRDIFEEIVLSRFAAWNGEKQIFECSIFQNIVEDMLLFAEASDEDIIDFYKRVKEVLKGKAYKIIYLETENIRESIEIIKKERSDEQGEEIWFPLMLSYFEESPYAKTNGLFGPEGLIKHLIRRQALELRVCKEIFAEQSVIWKSKKYELK